MTGTLAVRAGFRSLRTSGAAEQRAVQWVVQAVLPWALNVVHPSVWGLAAASAQLVLGGSLLVASGARLRQLARGTAALMVVGNGIDVSHLLGAVAQALSGGLEAALVIAVISLLRRVRRPR